MMELLAAALAAARQLRAIGLTVAALDKEAWRRVVQEQVKLNARTKDHRGRLAPSLSDLSALLRQWQERARREATPGELEYARRGLEEVRRLESEQPCEVCGGAQFVKVRVEADRQPVGVPCSCVPLSLRMAMCGINERYRGSAFENFEPLDGKTAALTAALQWDCARSVVLMGPVGTGKTHLAVCMATRAMRKMRPVRFIASSDFLAQLKARFGTDQVQPYFDAVANTHTLIIDDLGAEQDTEWATAQLGVLLNHRYTRQLPTVVTTNLDYAAVRASLGERIASRMSEWKWIAVEGVDVRPMLAESR